MAEYFSPAKVNLFLRIVGKRSCGYHELLTPMVALDFGDEITINASSSDSFFCNVNDIPTTTNSILKALALFRKHTEICDPVSITLKKRIPLGAGLGGGSSNAATTLFALNRLFSAGLSIEQMSFMGAQLGSDVPFFFSAGEAMCSGRGERVTTVPNEIGTVPQEFLLVFDSQGVSSAAAYQAFASNCTPSITNLFQLAKNDLEEAVFSFRKDLYRKKKFLEERFPNSLVMMSGSGATMMVFSPPHTDGPLIFEERALEYVLTQKIHRKQDFWYET